MNYGRTVQDHYISLCCVGSNKQAPYLLGHDCAFKLQGTWGTLASHETHGAFCLHYSSSVGIAYSHIVSNLKSACSEAIFSNFLPLNFSEACGWYAVCGCSSGLWVRAPNQFPTVASEDAHGGAIATSAEMSKKSWKRWRCAERCHLCHHLVFHVAKSTR